MPLSRSPLSKTPKQVFFNPINIFSLLHTLLLFFNGIAIYFFRLTSKFIFTGTSSTNGNESQDEINAQFQKNKEIVILTKEEYQSQLDVVQQTPLSVQLKMYMANSRIEYIQLHIEQIQILKCTINIIDEDGNANINENEKQKDLTLQDIDTKQNTEQEGDALETIQFDPCLIEQQVTKQITISNPTPYTVPYNIHFSHSYFSIHGKYSKRRSARIWKHCSYRHSDFY